MHTARRTTALRTPAAVSPRAQRVPALLPHLRTPFFARGDGRPRGRSSLHCEGCTVCVCVCVWGDLLRESILASSSSVRLCIRVRFVCVQRKSHRMIVYRRLNHSPALKKDEFTDI